LVEQIRLSINRNKTNQEIMKKAFCVLAMAFATVTFSSNNTFAQTRPTGAGTGTNAPAQTQPQAPAGAATQDDKQRERITAEQLPAEVVSAWTQGPQAQSQVSEIHKITKDDEVMYEITYAGTDGSRQTTKFKADGTQVREDEQQRQGQPQHVEPIEDNVEPAEDQN
jgi:hypothetical protein